MVFELFCFNFKTDLILKQKIMLNYNFTRIFEARGIARPYNFLVKAGYSANFATRVANNKLRKLNLDEVERFCVLLKCTPNDLLEWVPGADDGNDEKHPLLALKRDKPAVNISQMLKSVSLEKLADIEILIKKEIGK